MLSVHAETNSDLRPSDLGEGMKLTGPENHWWVSDLIPEHVLLLYEGF